MIFPNYVIIYLVLERIIRAVEVLIAIYISTWYVLGVNYVQTVIIWFD